MAMSDLDPLISVALLWVKIIWPQSTIAAELKMMGGIQQNLLSRPIHMNGASLVVFMCLLSSMTNVGYNPVSTDSNSSNAQSSSNITS